MAGVEAHAIAVHWEGVARDLGDLENRRVVQRCRGIGGAEAYSEASCAKDGRIRRKAGRPIPIQRARPRVGFISQHDIARCRSAHTACLLEGTGGTEGPGPAGALLDLPEGGGSGVALFHELEKETSSPQSPKPT